MFIVPSYAYGIVTGILVSSWYREIVGKNPILYLHTAGYQALQRMKSFIWCSYLCDASINSNIHLTLLTDAAMGHLMTCLSVDDDYAVPAQSL